MDHVFIDAGILQLALERNLEGMQQDEIGGGREPPDEAHEGYGNGGEIERDQHAAIAAARRLPDDQDGEAVGLAQQPQRGRPQQQVTQETGAARADDEQFGRQRIGALDDGAQGRAVDDRRLGALRRLFRRVGQQLREGPPGIVLDPVLDARQVLATPFAQGIQGVQFEGVNHAALRAGRGGDQQGALDGVARRGGQVGGGKNAGQGFHCGVSFKIGR